MVWNYSFVSVDCVVIGSNVSVWDYNWLVNVNVLVNEFEWFVSGLNWIWIDWKVRSYCLGRVYSWNIRFDCW